MQVVLITGASSGIGEGLAKIFYMAGSKLILVSRRPVELERVKNDLISLSKVCLWLRQVQCWLETETINWTLRQRLVMISPFYYRNQTQSCMNLRSCRLIWRISIQFLTNVTRRWQYMARWTCSSIMVESAIVDLLPILRSKSSRKLWTWTILAPWLWLKVRRQPIPSDNGR